MNKCAICGNIISVEDIKQKNYKFENIDGRAFYIHLSCEKDIIDIMDIDDDVYDNKIISIFSNSDGESIAK